MRKTEEKQAEIPADKKDGHFNLLKIDVEEYAKALKELQAQGKFFGDEDYDKIYLAWKNATDAVKAYQAELNKQTESGQAKIAEQEAKAAERKEAAQRRAEEQAEKALQKETEAEAKLQAAEAERQAKIEAETAEEEHLAQIRENAVVGNQPIVNVMERRKQILQEIADLEAAGVTHGYKDYDDRLQELMRLEQELKEYNDQTEKTATSYKRLSQSMKQWATRAGGLFSSLRDSVKGIDNGIKRLGEKVKSIFSRMDRSVKKSGTIFSTIATRFKGLALSLLIFNQISRAFDRATSAVKDGFSNLYTDNGKFKKSVDELKASVLTLKSAFAAAFRPLVDIAIPYIRMASDYMIELLDKAGQFIAAVTGQKTYTKVIRQTADAFKEAKKAAEGYLSSLDEINKFSPKDEESEIKMGVMFEETPVSARFKDMAEKFKDTLSKAFTPIREAWEREGQFVIDRGSMGWERSGICLGA